MKIHDTVLYLAPSSTSRSVYECSHEVIMNSLLFINTPITLYSCSLHRKCYHYFFVTGLRCLRQRCDCPVTRFQDRSYSERSETATLAQLYSPSDSRTSPSATKPRPCVTSHPDGLTPLVTAPSCCPYSAFGSDNQETHQQHTHCWCQYDSSFTTASGCGDEWSDGEKKAGAKTWRRQQWQLYAI